ncbi:unnamed protein product [Citrullus colocynthis]|uniref:Uncharacterized protein n=1 Tax=Citrullus colocynthis TaxID=252529 RepID=A0ABP0XQT3_9ROSI
MKDPARCSFSSLTRPRRVAQWFGIGSAQTLSIRSNYSSLFEFHKANHPLKKAQRVEEEEEGRKLEPQPSLSTSQSFSSPRCIISSSAFFPTPCWRWLGWFEYRP